MFVYKSRLKSIIKPLREILLILIIIILIPALFYSSAKLFSLDEDEEMISQLYEQQLDVVLFSVNQYLWDLNGQPNYFDYAADTTVTQGGLNLSQPFSPNNNSILPGMKELYSGHSAVPLGVINRAN